MKNIYTFDEYNLLGEDFFDELKNDRNLCEQEIDNILNISDTKLLEEFDIELFEEFDIELFEGTGSSAFKVLLSKIKKIKNSLKQTLKRNAVKYKRKREAAKGDSKLLRTIKKAEEAEDQKTRALYSNRAANLAKRP